MSRPGRPAGFDFGLLDVGGIVAVVAADDGIFAGLGQHLELVRLAAADGAGVRFHRPESANRNG